MTASELAGADVEHTPERSTQKKPIKQYEVRNQYAIVLHAMSDFYLVRDINSPVYFHQSTNIVLTKFGIMIILMVL